ncbi:ATP synthase subunit I [Scatolibacter rhodanostii]|uniref:ATP synthase subunit I n=1 Tax=Scatolibacter rhodanostii TaxID=2014781 RepID=UPI000C080D5A|nr:ATP synthase subunit I [Scatolibacter rhodanostii]
MKFSKEIKRNILFITVGTFSLSTVMIIVFLIVGEFSLPVLWGAIIGSSLASLNFYLMTVTLHKVADSDGNGKAIAGISYTLRNVMMLVGAAVAIALLKVNPISFLIPYIFPRISIHLMQIWESHNSKKSISKEDDDYES